MATIRKKINNFTLYIPKNTGAIHNYLRKWKKGKPDREPCFMKLIRDEIEPGMNIYEIGTNIGYQTFIMHKCLNGKGKIYAFEPYPISYELLIRSIKENKYNNIETHNIAISNQSGTTSFFINKSCTNLNSIKKTKNTNKKINVKCISLNDFIKDDITKFPNFIKMDIEGGEVQVFDGLYPILKNNEFPCKIILEVHPNLYSKDLNFQEQLKKYFDLGFYTKYAISATTYKPPQFKKQGYKPFYISTKIRRSIYKNIKNKDIINFLKPDQKVLCPKKKKYGKIIRAILLERK